MIKKIFISFKSKEVVVDYEDGSNTYFVANLEGLRKIIYEILCKGDNGNNQDEMSFNVGEQITLEDAKRFLEVTGISKVSKALE